MLALEKAKKEFDRVVDSLDSEVALEFLDWVEQELPEFKEAIQECIEADKEPDEDDLEELEEEEDDYV